MLAAMRTGNLPALLRLPERLVTAAKPDSLWQLAVLAGIVERLRLRGELYSYQVPTYYGMICAAFRR